jgi:DNA repair exonuclease SbcCD nuclease subunit
MSVIVDGNHDIPKVIHTGSPATFLEEFGEGVHIVNGTTYEVIQGNQWFNKRLCGRLAVHCLPYQQVYKGDFTGATPHSGCLNVLLAHGRVGGMPDLNTLGLPAGRIPPEVLRRGWDYIALGDWHIHRYQPLRDVPAYYAGSLEALDFSEAEKYPRDPGDQNVARGAIDVRLGENGQRTINSLLNDGRRRLLRLKVIDAANMDVEVLMKKLRQRLKNDFPPGALVRLEINNCPRAIWGQLDHEELEELRKQAGLSCHIRPNFIRPDAKHSSQAASNATLEEQWQQFLRNMVSDEGERHWLLQAGMERVEAARQELNRQHTVQDQQLMEIDHD